MLVRIRALMRQHNRRYFTTINPYLLGSLRNRRFYPLKEFQLETLDEIEAGHNVFVNSCTGSGKTLAYLLPIMNKLFGRQDANQNRSVRPWGTLILTLNKQLCLQIYREIRLLDPANRLDVYRTGSIAHLSPVIAELSKEPGQQDQQDIVQLINQNVAKTIQWVKTDILVSTPQLLSNMLTFYKTNKENEIYPQIVVIDQADLLLQIDQNVSHYTIGLIEKIRASIKGTEKDNKLQFVLAASSFPKKFKGVEAKEGLNRMFKPLTHVTGMNKHRLPDKLELLYVEMKQTNDEQLLKEKLHYLTRILLDRPGQRLIIFCNSRKHIDAANNLIKDQLGITSMVYYADLKTDQRNMALARFNSNQGSLLVSSDLGSRGLDFQLPVDAVIELDMAENVTNFINRAGRTGRNGRPGEIISFVSEKDRVFFQHLMGLKVDNEQFDQLFSRKRSYRKLYKDANDSK